MILSFHWLSTEPLYLYLEARAESRSEEKAVLALADLIPMIGESISSSMGRAILETARTIPLSGSAYSKSFERGMFVVLPSAAMIYKEGIRSYDSLSLTSCLSAHLDADIASIFYFKPANLAACISAPLSHESEIKAYISIPDLAVCLSAPLYAEMMVQSVDSSVIAACDACRMQASESHSSYESGLLLRGAPGYLMCAGKLPFYESASITPCRSGILQAQNPLAITHSAELVGAKILPLSASVNIKASYSALLEIDGEKETWWNPVRTGNNLYIRSVYIQWRDGVTVHLDSGIVWYEPVQRGTNLHIKSTYYQWQEDHKVHLEGGDIFYEPVRTGNNLYIRSADSMKGIKNE